MLNAETVGAAIRQVREKKGISQEVVSSFAGIGRTHLSAIERGQRKPTWRPFFASARLGNGSQRFDAGN